MGSFCNELRNVLVRCRETGGTLVGEVCTEDPSCRHELVLKGSTATFPLPVPTAVGLSPSGSQASGIQAFFTSLSTQEIKLGMGPDNPVKEKH
jgi:hypothetical protein